MYEAIIVGHTAIEKEKHYFIDEPTHESWLCQPMITYEANFTGIDFGGSVVVELPLEIIVQLLG